MQAALEDTAPLWLFAWCLQCAIIRQEWRVRAENPSPIQLV